MTQPIDRDQAEALDRADPLSGFRDRFVVEDDNCVYLDGNSLGRLPFQAVERLGAAVQDEWGRELVGAWDHWMTLCTRLGDQLGTTLLGARAGEVVLSDSTTVNLYKLAAGALDAGTGAGRTVIVTDTDNFPTDRYCLEGVAAARGIELRFFTADPVTGPDPASVAEAMGDGDDVALVSLSHVSYRTSAMADMAAVTRVAHERGAIMLWDLSHAVGAVPIDLTATGADLAVGCTYKYVNAGPGAPAFLYVRRELQERLTQPIWGWFGQRNQFAMGPGYDPSEGVSRWLVGSPPVLSLVPVEVGVGLLAEAGMHRLRDKSVRLTSLVIELADAWLAESGIAVGSPRDPARRGSHVALRHPAAEEVVEVLRRDHGVVADFRGPDVIRFGLAPLYNRYTEAWDAMHALRRTLSGSVR